jgi:pimeloyl-ACP methyl ester carboxylesterase
MARGVSGGPAQGPTSFGGVLAMMLAVLPPAAVAGIILNDIDDAYR